MGRIESHRDLIVWQKGMDLAAEAYRLGKQMPRAEEYRLISQLLSAAASVPANLAEGHARGTRKDYAHFVNIAGVVGRNRNVSDAGHQGRTA